jgi:hypothetical protein
LDRKKLEAIFWHKVFDMRIATRDFARNDRNARNGAAFRIPCTHENRIQPKEDKAMESLARYIIRASFSQERMQYHAEVEGHHILTILETTNWGIEGSRGAAILFGLHPNTLRGGMRKLGNICVAEPDIAYIDLLKSHHIS